MKRGVRSRTNYKDIDLSTSIHTDTEHMAHLATRRVDVVTTITIIVIFKVLLSTIFISQSNACCGWPMDRLKTEFDPVKVNAIGNRLTHYQKVNMVDEYWIGEGRRCLHVSSCHQGKKFKHAKSRNGNKVRG